MSNHKKADIGDCDCCPDKHDVHVVFMDGMFMCDDCAEKQRIAIRAQKLIDESRKQDSSIKLSADIINASTVSFIELKGAMNNDPSIPADQVEYRMVEECAARIDKMSAAIFAKEQEVMTLKNERLQLLVNTQELVSRLKVEHRGKFAKYNVNYASSSPTKKEKSVKPAKTGKPFDKAAVYAAAKKYNVPAAQIQGMVVSRQISADDAAKELHALLN